MLSAAVLRLRNHQPASMVKLAHRFSVVKPMMFQYQRVAMYYTTVKERPADFNVSDDLSQVKLLSLDNFYGSIADHSLTDEEALEYMQFAAKMAMVSFKDQEEMLSFKVDFQAALAFIQKLDEVDVSGAKLLFANDFLWRGSAREKSPWAMFSNSTAATTAR